MESIDVTKSKSTYSIWKLYNSNTLHYLKYFAAQIKVSTCIPLYFQ